MNVSRRTKVISLAAMCFVLIAAAVLFVSRNEEEVSTPESQFKWYYINKAWIVDTYVGSDAHVVVPASRSYAYPVTDWLGGYFSKFTTIKTIPRRFPVIEITSEAFLENKTLESITLPQTIITLSGFVRCSKLWEVHLENGIKIIGDGAFSGCVSLKTISLPDSVEVLGNAVFQSCTSLETFILPPALKSVSPWTFQNCAALHSCEFAPPITSIGNTAFSGCTSLQNLDFPVGLI